MVGCVFYFLAINQDVIGDSCWISGYIIRPGGGGVLQKRSDCRIKLRFTQKASKQK
jgi:hypothetical protein